MCTCIKDVSEKLRQRAFEQATEKNQTLLPENSAQGDGLDGVILVMVPENSGFDHLLLSTKFQHRITFKKKDSSDSQPKKISTTMSFTFCPFCGVEYKKKVS